MSERISIVVPDGTRLKLQERSKKNGQTQSSFSRKVLLDALKECEHLMIPAMQDGTPIINGGYQGPYFAKCIKCGLMP